jgi:hypothetical protein
VEPVKTIETEERGQRRAEPVQTIETEEMGQGWAATKGRDEVVERGQTTQWKMGDQRHRRRGFAAESESIRGRKNWIGIKHELRVREREKAYDLIPC